MSVAASMVQTLQALPGFARDTSDAEVVKLARALEEAMCGVNGIIRARKLRHYPAGTFAPEWCRGMNVKPPRGAS